MKTIYKYQLTAGAPLKMPYGAKILHVGEQALGAHRLGLFVWAQVDTKLPLVERRIEVVGTGWPDRDGGAGKHVGTVICRDALVWHVFDHGEEPT